MALRRESDRNTVADKRSHGRLGNFAVAPPGSQMAGSGGSMTAGRTTRALLLLATLLSGAISVRAQELEIAPDRPSGVYATGEKATWKVALKGGEPAAVKKAGYVLKKGGLTYVAWGEM